MRPVLILLIIDWFHHYCLLVYNNTLVRILACLILPDPTYQLNDYMWKDLTLMEHGYLLDNINWSRFDQLMKAETE